MRSALLALALLAAGCADADAPAVDADTDIAVADGPPADGSLTPLDAADGTVASTATDGDAGIADATPGDAGLARAGKTGDAATDDRPATRTLSVMAEGESYEQAVKLVSFPDFPAPFSTYVFDDMPVEQPGSGDAVSIEWGAGRVLVNWARETNVEETLARLEADLPGAESFPAYWTAGAYTFASPDAVGTAFVTLKDGTTVVIESSSSIEGAEGAAAIEEVILDQWRWADGTPLRPAR